MDDDAFYIIDSSSLISFHQWRPMTKNRDQWQKLSGLIDNDTLISPEEVYGELTAGNDALALWAKRQRKGNRFFRRTTRQHVGVVKEILRKFKDLIDVVQTVPEADPFVVALAYHEIHHSTLTPKCVVITEEKFTPSGRPRIPHVCAHYKIPYMSIHQVFVVKGWTF